MLKFDANLYRIAAMCQSKEETRYYLCGVLVEPHPVKGVILTATDGHKLVCIHDENGTADETAIIALSPEAFKACTPKRDKRTIVVDGIGATVFRADGFAEDADQIPIAVSAKCRVDGTFPDYRRVIPTVAFTAESRPGYFAGNNLSAFADMALQLEKHFDRAARDISQGPAKVRIAASSDNDPALVTFARCSEAFGVVMPVRSQGSDETFAPPAWFTAKPVDTAAAIAA